MALLSLKDISIAFGGRPLLDKTTLHLERQERVCLLGRNGSGKSTLMKIVAGMLEPDGGTVYKDAALRIAYLGQEIPEHIPGSVLEIIARGLGIRGETLLRYRSANDLAGHPELQAEMDRLNAWQVEDEIAKLCSRLQIELKAAYNTLSGGQKRRTLLARALVSEPDVLLLDEPTNHLDIATIDWLEAFLLKYNGTLLFVTHDRMLLQRLATRIVELDRGKLQSWACDYQHYLQRKQVQLEAEETQQANFDRKLAQEEAWIRRGIRARRTRNEGRVRALQQMRQERAERREQTGTAQMQVQEAGRSGKLVIEAKDVSFAYEGEPLIRGLNLRIGRGDKLGIVGPNGCGKTTLVQLLLKNFHPQQGTVTHGTNLEIAYFDQQRAQLDPEKSVWENVLPNGDKVFVNGKSRHIISYLEDFLFSPERSKSPVKQLSGGERNRLLLARLFTQPANLLVLDEPTNDLDSETLELLEALLVEFSGTVLLISHDRAFINNVVTSVLGFESGGMIREVVGGYDAWQKTQLKSAPKSKNGASKKEAWRARNRSNRPVKRSYKEEQELLALPAKIEVLEQQQGDLHTKMADPGLYRDKEQVLRLKEELQRVEAELEKAYARWEQLEAKGKDDAI